MRKTPLSPIFNPYGRRGVPNYGTAIGAPPPCLPTLTIFGSVHSSVDLDAPTNLVKIGDTVFVDGDNTRQLTSVDVSDPANPTIISGLKAPPLQLCKNILVDGNYAYVAESFGIAVVDLVSPTTAPVAYASQTGASFQQGMVQDGDYLYVTCQATTRMMVVDVSDPLDPVVVGVLNNSNLNNAYGIVKSGNYCFIASAGVDRFVVVDVTTPASPTFVTAVGTGGLGSMESASGLVKIGNTCIVVAAGGVTCVDVTTPTSPVVGTHVNNSTANTSLAHPYLDGNNLYVATSTLLFVWDVSTPTAPTQIGTLNLSSLGDTGGKRIAKSGNYLYITSDTQDRVRIVDVSTPSAPTSAGSFADSTAIDGALGIAISGTDLYVAGSGVFSALDITSATSPTLDWSTYGGLLGGSNGMTRIGDYVLSHVRDTRSGSGGLGNGGITTTDVSDPSAMVFVNQLLHADLANSFILVTDGTYLYLGSQINDRIIVVDASDPTNLSYVTTFTDSTNLDGIAGMAVSGSYLYVAAATADRLTIVDVSTPATPSVVGSVQNATLLDVAFSIAVAGNYAYVGALTQNRLTVVDISNPAAPSVVGSVQDATNLHRPFAIAVEDDVCFVTCQTANRVTAVDVSDPTTPTVMVSVQDNINLDRPVAIVKDGAFLYVPCTLADRMTVVEYTCV